MVGGCITLANVVPPRPPDAVRIGMMLPSDGTYGANSDSSSVPASIAWPAMVNRSDWPLPVPPRSTSKTPVTPC